jgi:hypothetical protein
MIFTARGLGPALAHHTSLVAAALVTAICAGLVFFITARALKTTRIAVRTAGFALATTTLFVALHLIG